MHYSQRRERLRVRLRAHGADAVAMSYGPNLRYYTGWEPHAGERPVLLVVTLEGDALLLPRLHAADAERLDIGRRATFGDEGSPTDALRPLVSDLLGPAPHLLVEDGMRTDFALMAREALRADRLRLAGAVLEGMRLYKDEDELDRLRAVARLTDRALERTLTELRTGTSEIEVAAAVQGAMAEEGADGTSFAIVGFGPNSAEAHYRPGSRRLRHGDAVLIDVGAHKDGYVSDITRLAHAGPPSQEYLTAYGLVREALGAALSCVRPGTAVRDVDRAAREVIADGGRAAAFRHRVGHGIGLATHEPPYLTAADPTPLEEGMVVTVEPGIYLIGRFGIRLEEAVIVTESGYEKLSRVPLDIHPVAGV